MKEIDHEIIRKIYDKSKNDDIESLKYFCEKIQEIIAINDCTLTQQCAKVKV